jgi:hypothetical protein
MREAKIAHQMALEAVAGALKGGDKKKHKLEGEQKKEAGIAEF